MFFLIRDWFLETEDPCLLARDMEVARDNDAVSWFIAMDWLLFDGEQQFIK